MTTPMPNKLLVDAAAPERYQFGLMSVATIREAEGHWQIGGVEYDSDQCAQGDYVVGPCAARPREHHKHDPQGLNTVQGSNPFTVYHRAECNTIGFQDAAAIARRRMSIVEPRVVEKFFAREVLGRHGETVFPLGRRPARPVPLKYGIGLLEQHAAMHYGGVPTLHAPRWLWPWIPTQDTRDTGAVQRTKLNTKVAFGAEYLDDPFDPPTRETVPAPPGRGGTHAGGSAWLFASGQVRIWRASTQVVETTDPPTNTRLALGERTYAIDWDCYLAGVLVDLGRELEVSD